MSDTAPVPQPPRDPRPLLQGRVAVITGGASGIGRSTAFLLASHGARVFATDYRLRPENERAFAAVGIVQRQCDVRHEAAVQEQIDAIVQDAGRIDILVNNAGINMTRGITEVTEEDWDRCLDTNLKGPFFGCKHAIRYMIPQGGGSIVNTASNAGLLPRVHDPVYSISKMALVALTKSLALCHARDRIRINCVCPGPVEDTEMMNTDLASSHDPQQAAEERVAASPLAQAFGRMIRPDEVAQAILYLVSDAAAMVTGTAIAIDGGKSLGVPPR